MTTLTPSEILYVRIIKGRWHKRRGMMRRAVAYACGVSYTIIETHDVAEKLLTLVQKFDLYSMRDFMYDMNPDQDWRYTSTNEPAPSTYFERVVQRLQSKIRLTAISRLPGYIPRRINRHKHIP